MALGAKVLDGAKAGRLPARWDYRMSEFPRPDLLLFYLHIPSGWKVRMFVCDCAVGSIRLEGTVEVLRILLVPAEAIRLARPRWLDVLDPAHTHTHTHSWLGFPKPRPTPRDVQGQTAHLAQGSG